MIQAFSTLIAHNSNRSQKYLFFYQSTGAHGLLAIYDTKKQLSGNLYNEKFGPDSIF